MKGNITGENDERIGLYVNDNNKIEHWIEMEFDGEIKYHEQDGYPDEASNRTKEGNEHVKQARRYAKYYVYCERGYPTLEPVDIPEWQVIVATAISQLSLEAFETHFGRYHQQFQSLFEDDIDPVVDVPEEDVAGLRVYLLSVHLGLAVEDYLDDDQLEVLDRAFSTDTDPDDLFETVTNQLEGIELGPDVLSIAGVSDVGVLYQGTTRDIEQPGNDPYPSPADARLELSPTDIPGEKYLSLEEFQVLVVHHLLCQARDCYLQMGLEPPESLRILGLGKYRQTVRNEHLGMYEPVHSTSSSVNGYSVPEIGTHIDSNPS